MTMSHPTGKNPKNPKNLFYPSLDPNSSCQRTQKTKPWLSTINTSPFVFYLGYTQLVIQNNSSVNLCCRTGLTTYEV